MVYSVKYIREISEHKNSIVTRVSGMKQIIKNV